MRTFTVALSQKDDKVETYLVSNDIGGDLEHVSFPQLEELISPKCRPKSRINEEKK